MRKRRNSTNGAWPVISLLAGAGLISILFVRRWLVRWGASDLEARWPLPGDELLPHPKINATHAVTVNAAPGKVWPWLVQMGQGRGGFYTYELVENLIGADMSGSPRVRPEWQALKVGDSVSAAPNDGNFRVAILNPNLDLVLSGRSPAGNAGGSIAGVWGWHLAAIDANTTRLIERCRCNWSAGPLAWLFMRLFVEPAAFMIERKNLLGIKERAETYG